MQGMKQREGFIIILECQLWLRNLNAHAGDVVEEVVGPSVPGRNQNGERMIVHGESEMVRNTLFKRDRTSIY